MFLLHYIIPLIIFYFYKDKIMLWGLLLGNLIDLDYIYYRLIGKVGWFESACPSLGTQCSLGYYPLHTLPVFLIAIIFSPLVFHKNKKIRFIGWLCLGALLNLFLDYIHMITGFGI